MQTNSFEILPIFELYRKGFSSCRTPRDEERNHDEVRMIQGIAITPQGVPTANPAFDVTPARYVGAIITERGVVRAPYDESLRTL